MCSISREVGYEVVDKITDFKGFNHTMINFNNNFQFIPTGRCVLVGFYFILCYSVGFILSSFIFVFDELSYWLLEVKQGSHVTKRSP